MSASPGCQPARRGACSRRSCPAWPSQPTTPVPVLNPPRTRSTPTGNVRPRMWWSCCAPRLGTAPTTRPVQPHRRAVHPQRELPHLVGRPQRPLPPHRHRAIPPSRRRRPHFTYEALDLAADAGLRISAYTAEPGAPSEDALRLLDTWAATLAEEDNRPGRVVWLPRSAGAVRD